VTDPDWAAPRSYASVASIGSQCLTATLLRAAGLRSWSGPFDWIFSNLRMVGDCIEDDFRAFLDPENLIPIAPDLRAAPDIQFADHRLYRARYRLRAIFNHSDPTRPEVYAYLERCVARFRSALRSGRPHLLVGVSTKAQGGRQAFVRLAGLLADHAAVELLVFMLRDPAPDRSTNLWEERGRHRLVDLHLPSPIAGIWFADAEDDRFLVETLQSLIRLDPSAG
jgi:hypothetical protein